MHNHATERDATHVNQLAILQEDFHVGTDQYCTERTVSPVETKGSLQNILEKQGKVSIRDPSYIMKPSGTEEHTASCSDTIYNPTHWKILKNQDLDGKS